MQQLKFDRQDNARQPERLCHHLELQANLLEGTEAHLDRPASCFHFRASETKPNISVYHACITTLEIRLDQLEG